MPRPRFQLLRTAFRCAFHAAAALSTLALVACLILWPRSYYYVDQVVWKSPHQEFALADAQGRAGGSWSRTFIPTRLGLSWTSRRPSAAPSWSYTAWAFTKWPPFGLECYDYLGVSVTRNTYSGKPGRTSFSLQFSLHIPFSYLTVLTAILPALWLWAWRKRRRAQRARGFPVGPGGGM